MLKNLLVPFVFAFAVTHTARADPGDTCPGSGPIELSSSCSEYNCFDGAHIWGADISCTTGLSEAQCASMCCSQTDCTGFDYTASDQGLGAGHCCTSYVSRVEVGFQQHGGTYRSCEKNSITCAVMDTSSSYVTCWIDILTASNNGEKCWEKSCPPLHTKGKEGWCKMHPEAENVCCGDHCCKPNSGAIAGTVIGVVGGLTLLIVSSCYYGRCGCFRYRRDQLIAASVAARPQQPQVVYVQQATQPQVVYVQQATPAKAIPSV